MTTSANRRIWVVSGPSSVGKTTFIDSPRLGEVTGAPAGVEVHIASSGGYPERGDLVVHYNIQRPLHQRLLEGGAEDPSGVRAAALDFDRDPLWARLREEPGLEVVVLAAEVERLRRRVLRRSSIEQDGERYPVESWLERFRVVDVRDVYRAWLAELERRGLAPTLIDASDREFRALASPDELLALLDGRAPDWPRERIEQWLDPDRFQYQRVPLPFGLATSGGDRSATRDLVFREPVAGKTVLEVGSSEGYFCFEAELGDAARVRGLEPKPERYELACRLREIRGSRVEFERREVVEEPLTDDWDVVLLLNVIHHLADPMRVLANLAERARERLVIEFPTFADPRFRARRRIRAPWLYHRKPVIGVSDLVCGVAQTYVYSPAAIRALLLDQGLPIRRVEIERSPIAGRAIAHAWK